MKSWKLVVISLVLIVALFSCRDKNIPVTSISVEVTFPDALSVVLKDDVSIQLVNQNTGKSYEGLTDIEGKMMIEVPEGIYNVSASASKEYSTIAGSETFIIPAILVATKEGVSVIGKTQTLNLSLLVSINNNTWVFKELYVTGSRTPEDKSYRSDKYFSIVNNSDKVLYADGISISESHILTIDDDPYYWAFIASVEEAFIAQTVYTIPGTGEEHPVQPGESIILADVGINHTSVNENSFDLSMANFEWYDESKTDPDVPEVPNLDKNFSYSSTIWTPHNKGYRSYVIFKQDVDMADFIASNTVEGKTASGKTLFRIKIPNTYIIDAVEMSIPSRFTQKVIAASLDASYTYCGDGGEERYGKCVRRKVVSEVDGRKIYMDTNNSAVDFETTVTPMPGM